MPQNKIVIWRNPETEETEVYLTASAMRALADFEVSVIEEDAFGDLSSFEAVICQWKQIPSKVRKATK